MTRRLIFVPLVTGPIAAAAVGCWLSGYVWPVAMQVWSVLAPRPVTDTDEADVWA